MEGFTGGATGRCEGPDGLLGMDESPSEKEEVGDSEAEPQQPSQIH